MLQPFRITLPKTHMTLEMKAFRNRKGLSPNGQFSGAFAVLECVAQVFVSRWLYAMDFFLPHHLAHLHLRWDLRKSVFRLISDRCDHVSFTDHDHSTQKFYVFMF